MGSVRILQSTCDAAAITAAAGRISTTKGAAGEVYRKSLELGREKNLRLIEKILSSGHASVLEHVYVNLAFEDVSVLAEQFLIEFRLASFTVKSRRYVDFARAGWFTPAFSGPGGAEMTALYDGQVQALFDVYGALTAAGIPKEDARFVLPYCFHSNFYCTVNGRELVHIMNELAYGRGRTLPELRALGESLFAQCEEKLPFLARRQRERYGQPALSLPAAVAETPAEGPLAAVASALDYPEDAICRAALQSRGLSGELTDEQKRAVIQAQLRSSRCRELEQVCFTVTFRRLSLAALTHLTRHRMQSLVPPKLTACCSPERYVLPPSVAEAGMEETYRRAFRQMGETAARLRALGMTEEESAYLLLSGQTVPVTTTVNARELAVFFRLRLCCRAQWEIRQSAEAALAALRERCPLLFSCYGPACFMDGRCPEGAMSCGRMAEMAEKYGRKL